MLILKRSGGPVVAVCQVTTVQFFTLDASTRATLQAKYTRPICADEPGFWEERAEKRYATLMGVGDVQRLPDLNCSKKDRRGWVSLLE